MSVLKLTVFKEVFELIVSGEKTEEIRLDSKWIKSRLFKADGTERKYKKILFRNGYRKNAAYCVCSFEGFRHADLVHFSYSTGLTIDLKDQNIYVLYIGEVLEIANYHV